jgi:hypothetical protein
MDKLSVYLQQKVTIHKEQTWMNVTHDMILRLLIYLYHNNQVAEDEMG